MIRTVTELAPCENYNVFFPTKEAGDVPWEGPGREDRVEVATVVRSGELRARHDSSASAVRPAPL
jgi:hypothetical protein